MKNRSTSFLMLYRSLLPLFLIPFSLIANDFSTVQQERESDAQAVEEFLASKDIVTHMDSSGELTMSGDVETEWAYTDGHANGKKLRGRNVRRTSQRNDLSSAEAVNTNQFTIEVDLMLNYQAETTWAEIMIECTNDAGCARKQISKGINNNKNILSGSGTLDNIALLQAYMGAHLVHHPHHSLDLEVGRRRFYDVFDSKVQFNSIFDGLLLTYHKKLHINTDLALYVGPFVIDQDINHFGYVGEINFLGLNKSPFDLKYSLISWQKKGCNAQNKRNSLGSRFLTSQITAIWHLDKPGSICYAAFLYNSAATGNWRTHGKKANKGFYVGATYGQVAKKSDWSLDLNYQYVQAQTVTEWDVSGIGRDNPSGISFYNKTWGGFANYKGYVATLMYALTNNLTLTTVYQNVHTCSRRIGGTFSSQNLQLYLIYTF